MTVALIVAGAWVALSIPCALFLGHLLRELDEGCRLPAPPARHLHVVRH